MAGETGRGPSVEERLRLRPVSGIDLPEIERFRREESTLILLNLAVLAALLLVHEGFAGMLGTPSRSVFLAISVFFLVQTVELVVIQSLRRPLSALESRVYPLATIVINLAFAFWISVTGGFEDSHYAVLMVLPVASAASRFALPKALGVASLAIVLTFTDLWIYYVKHPPVRAIEFYEASTISLIYLVVAVVVGYLAGHLRRDRQALRQSLAELEQAKGRLVAEEKLAAVGRLSSAIAHEVRNPVTMLARSAALLEGGSLSNGDAQEMFRIVGKEAARLEKLTSDFLAYARVKEPERKDASLMDTLTYVAGVVKASAQTAGVSVHIDAPLDATLHVDPYQLHRALLNLLANAVDAAPRGSVVDLRAKVSHDRSLAISVENAGEPLPEDVRGRLFEPFFTTKSNGTGLGLAIARNIARAHGGEVSFVPTADGRTRFDVILPGVVILSESPRS